MKKRAETSTKNEEKGKERKKLQLEHTFLYWFLEEYESPLQN